MGVGIFHISIAFVFLIILFLELFSLRFYRSVGSTNVLGVSLNGTEVSGTSLKNAYRGRGKILMQLQGERVSRFSTRSQVPRGMDLGTWDHSYNLLHETHCETKNICLAL